MECFWKTPSKTLCFRPHKIEQEWNDGRTGRRCDDRERIEGMLFTQATDVLAVQNA